MIASEDLDPRRASAIVIWIWRTCSRFQIGSRNAFAGGPAEAFLIDREFA
jgi:hypothetical protein